MKSVNGSIDETNHQSKSYGLAGQQKNNGINGHQIHKRTDVDNNVILEDEYEHVDEQSDGGQLDKDIKDFLKKSKIELQRQG